VLRKLLINVSMKVFSLYRMEEDYKRSTDRETNLENLLSCLACYLVFEMTHAQEWDLFCHHLVHLASHLGLYSEPNHVLNWKLDSDLSLVVIFVFE
jgi:hypothetical protein